MSLEDFNLDDSSEWLWTWETNEVSEKFKEGVKKAAKKTEEINSYLGKDKKT